MFSSVLDLSLNVKIALHIDKIEKLSTAETFTGSPITDKTELPILTAPTGISLVSLIVYLWFDYHDSQEF